MVGPNSPILTQMNETQSHAAVPYPQKKTSQKRTGAALANDVLQRQQSTPSQKVSVCHIASGDGWGGAEVQVATLLSSLAARNDVSACAIVLNGGRLASELRQTGIDVKVIPENEKPFPRIVAESAEFLRGRGVQVIHSHRYKENLLALLLALRYPVRLVRTQHGQPEPYTGFSGVKQRFVYAVDRQLARHAADRVISVSSDLTRYLQSHVSSSKIAVIRNGIALQKVQSKFSQAEAKQRLFIRPDAPVIGIATRLTAIKRLDLFVAAATCITRAEPQARFVISGGGMEEDHLRQFIESAGLQHEILLLGHREDVYDVMRAMDIMMLTSDHEGLPMVLLEAMALGIPVLSRQVGGIPEVIQDGVTGVLVNSDSAQDLAAACSSLLLDTERRKQIVANARAKVELSYSAEKNAADITQIYHCLVSSR